MGCFNQCSRCGRLLIVVGPPGRQFLSLFAIGHLTGPSCICSAFSRDLAFLWLELVLYRGLGFFERRLVGGTIEIKCEVRQASHLSDSLLSTPKNQSFILGSGPFEIDGLLPIGRPSQWGSFSGFPKHNLMLLCDVD